jgi:hypothetical protein
VANLNGTIEIGLNIVVSPGAAPVHLAVPINTANFGGTWRDSAGGTGNFVLTPGAGSGGGPRPVPVSAGIPNLIHLQTDGGFLAGGALGVGNIPASGSGARMMWYPGKAAFRAGHVNIPAWDDNNVGLYSAAFGINTVAGGDASTAFGSETAATGLVSTAFGQSTLAQGPYSVATGYFSKATAFASFSAGSQTQANGAYSTALGSSTIASGTASMAAGANTAASGVAGFALGNGASASGSPSFAAGKDTYAIGNQTVVLGSYARSLVAGAFMFGDASTTSAMFALDPNSFTVRAAGGYRLFTNAALTTGVTLAAGGSGWGVVSDVNMKENFRDLDDADVLAKIARMPIREWNYITQDPSIRHIGPTAQDFRAAFDLGESPLSINTIDADGISLRAIQALEVRTRDMRTANDTLVRENGALKTELAALRDRLDRLEQLLLETR